MATRPLRDASGPVRLGSPPGAAVVLSGVSRLFGTVAALVRVDLRLAEGEVALLRGPNGAGKTTLLRILATAIRPTYGHGRVLGHDLRTERSEIRARTELLGHRTRLYDDLTAEENLRVLCRLYGLPSGGVPGALRRAGLAGVGGERVRGFSQGMRQRLAVARAILRSPRLLLLDEPYAGLDAEARVLVEDVARRVADSGGAVIVATHDASPGVEPHRVLVMEAGTLAEDRA